MSTVASGALSPAPGRDPVEGPRLQITAVSKAFGAVRALSDVALECRAGEVHGLIGENGAGKSTLMAVAAGALVPDAGEVLIDGEPVAGDPARARQLGLAIVHQEPSLMPDLTVAENMLLSLEPTHRPSTSRIDSWASGLLREWNEENRIRPGARVTALNAEERFTVEIVKALAREPKVLVLDEPTEHLSTEDVERLFERIRRLASRGVAVIYISHRIREVQRISERVSVLRDGRSQGTFLTTELTEGRIIELIAGRTLSATFPDKPQRLDGEDRLVVRAGNGNGFHDVDLNVRRGEILGLAGIEGNGQRAFARSLAGLNGDRLPVELDGERVRVRSSAAAARAGIAYLSGERALEGVYADLTVRENFGLRNLAATSTLGFVASRKEVDAARTAVERFSVKADDISTPIGSLSGGNQQKVALASAMSTSPRVLIADEPTQGVDVGAKADIYQHLRAIADSGNSVVVLSSDNLELAGLCDRVAVFSRGQIAAEVTGDDVTERAITTAMLTATASRERASRLSPIRRLLDNTYLPVMVIAVAMVGLGALAAQNSPFYLTGRNLTGMLTMVAVLGLAAFAQQLVILTGGIDLSVGPLMSLTLVIGSFYLVDGMPPAWQLVGWVAIFAACIATGVANWLLVDVLKAHPMVATLATYMGILAVAQLMRPTPGGLISTAITDPLSTAVGFVPVALIAVVSLALVLEMALFRSILGITLRGVGSRADAARMIGIRPKRVRLMAYVACSVLAGCGGVLLMAQAGSGDAGAGTSYTLTSVAAVVLGGASIFGGRGSFIAALMGAFMLTQVSSVTTFLELNDAWQYFLLGGLTLVAVAAYSFGRSGDSA